MSGSFFIRQMVYYREPTIHRPSIIVTFFSLFQKK